MPLQIETQPFQFNSTVTGLSSAVFNSVSAVSLSGTHYGDGSKLSGITATVTAVSGTVNQINASKSDTTVTLSLPNSAIFPGDVSIIGNLTIAGSATYIDTKNLIVGDNIIYFNDNNYGSNVLDMGIVSHLTQAPLGYNHTGLIRRAGEGVPGVWTLFSGLTTEPASAANIDWNDKNIKLDSLSANLIGNVTGNASTVTNGVYTNQSYSDPSWITSLADTKITGTEFATNTLLQSTSALLTPLTTTNSLTSQLVLNTAFGNYQTSVASSTATLLPISVYRNASGSFVPTTAINSLTGNWNTAYQTVSTIPYILNQSLSATTTLIGSNTASNTFSEVLGGVCNLASGTYSTVVNASSSCATAPFTFVGAGSGNKATGNYAVAVGGQCNTASGIYSFIGGGRCNTASGIDSTVAGGCLNRTINKCSTIGGGAQNCVAGDQGTISGGYQNCMTGAYGIIAGGFRNCSSGTVTFIGGGCNTVSGSCASVIGGILNSVPGAGSVIAGGLGNYNPLRHSIIGGGLFNHTGGYAPANITFGANLSGNGTNTALIAAGIGSCFSNSNTTGAVTLVWMTSGTANQSLSSACFTTANVVTNAANCIIVNGDYSACSTGLSACSIYVYDRCVNTVGCNNFIGGGTLNTASGCYSTIGGGTRNVASCFYTTVGGGNCNTANCNYSTVAGGTCNTASGTYSFVGGGITNNAGARSVVAGGRSNTASAYYGAIVAGTYNCICGTNNNPNNSFIGAGARNFVQNRWGAVVGGCCNNVSGCWGVIGGGYLNTASGMYSFVAGGSANDTKGFSNTFILGTTLSATRANFTYVNNLSVQGNIASNTNYTATAYLSANVTASQNTDNWLPLSVKNDPNNWVTNTGAGGALSGTITPTVPGYYFVNYQIAWNTTTGSGQNNAQIRLNGSTTKSLVQMPLFTGSGGAQTQTATAIVYLNGVSDSLNFSGYSSAAAQQIVGTTDGNWTKVEIFKIN